MSTSRGFLTSGMEINKHVGSAQAELFQKYYLISCHSSPEAYLWSGEEATKGQPRGLSLESFIEKIMNTNILLSFESKSQVSVGTWIAFS